MMYQIKRFIKYIIVFYSLIGLIRWTFIRPQHIPEGHIYAAAKGVYEITAGRCTRFIPANVTKQLLAIAALAFITGRWMVRRKREKEKYLCIRHSGRTAALL